MVEVGGFKPFVRLNPPAAELEPLADKHWRMLCRLAELLPELSITQTKVESLGEGVWRVTVVLVNQGYLPTMPEMGRINGEPHPLQAAVELPAGAKLVTGYRRVRVPVLSAGEKAEQTWLVQTSRGGEATVRIRVWSPSVGEASVSVRLSEQQPPRETKP